MVLMLYGACRHHTNPVGTEWRWKMDNPGRILKECLGNHYQIIKQFRGTVCNYQLHYYHSYGVLCVA